MKGPKSVFVILTLMIFISISSAQITITQGSLLPIGSSYTSYGLYSDVEVDHGSAGANQTWEIPAYEWDYVTPVAVVDPGETPYSGDFPTADRAMGDVEGDGWTFYRATSNAYYMLGSGTSAGVTVLEEEALVTPLPMTYNTPDWTVVVRTSFEMEGMTMTTIDSSINNVDGWGTLNTPYGSHQTLRIFGHGYMSTLLNGEPMFSDEFVSYMWFNQQGLDVGEISSMPGETDPNFTMGSVIVADYATPVDPIRGPVVNSFSVGQNYPNPFNPTTSLPISLEKAGTVEITIYNELGEVISSETRSFGPGNHTVGFDGSAWASGTYFANVKAGEQQITKKMQLVK